LCFPFLHQAPPFSGRSWPFSCGDRHLSTMFPQSGGRPCSSRPKCFSFLTKTIGRFVHSGICSFFLSIIHSLLFTAVVREPFSGSEDYILRKSRPNPLHRSPPLSSLFLCTPFCLISCRKSYFSDVLLRSRWRIRPFFFVPSSSGGRLSFLERASSSRMGHTPSPSDRLAFSGFLFVSSRSQGEVLALVMLPFPKVTVSFTGPFFVCTVWPQEPSLYRRAFVPSPCDDARVVLQPPVPLFCKRLQNRFLFVSHSTVRFVFFGDFSHTDPQLLLYKDVWTFFLFPSPPRLFFL